MQGKSQIPNNILYKIIQIRFYPQIMELYLEPHQGVFFSALSL